MRALCLNRRQAESAAAGTDPRGYRSHARKVQNRVAMDADADGAKLAEIVHDAMKLTGRDDLSYVFQEPFGYKDWNDQIRKWPTHSLSSRAEEPSVA